MSASLIASSSSRDGPEATTRAQVLREIAEIEARLSAMGEPHNSHQETVHRVFSALLQYRMRVLAQVDTGTSQ